MRVELALLNTTIWMNMQDQFAQKKFWMHIEQY